MGGRHARRNQRRPHRDGTPKHCCLGRALLSGRRRGAERDPAQLTRERTPGLPCRSSCCSSPPSATHSLRSRSLRRSALKSRPFRYDRLLKAPSSVCVGCLCVEQQTRLCTGGVPDAHAQGTHRSSVSSCRRPSQTSPSSGRSVSSRPLCPSGQPRMHSRTSTPSVRASSTRS